MIAKIERTTTSKEVVDVNIPSEYLKMGSGKFYTMTHYDDARRIFVAITHYEEDYSLRVTNELDLLSLLKESNSDEWNAEIDKFVKHLKSLKK